MSLKVHRCTFSCFVCTDRGLTIVGERGTISTDDCWFYAGDVYLQQTTKFDEFVSWISPKIRPLRKIPGVNHLLEPGRKKVPLVREADFDTYSAGQRMEFARGPAEMLAAISAGRQSGLSAAHALHVNEITLAMQYPEKMGHVRKLKTTFEPISPIGRELITAN